MPRRARAGTARPASRRPPVSRSARRRQARPADLAGQAQRVEHATARSRRRAPAARALPRVGRRARSRRAARRLRAARRAPVRRADGVDVLPREQEPHEVGGADRLDLRAQAIERVAVDARQQPPIAPFERRGSADRVRSDRGKRAAQHDALALRARAAPRRRRLRRSPASAASAAAVVGPTMARRPRSSSTIASSRVHARAARDGGRVDRRLERAAGMNRAQFGQPFGGDPDDRVDAACPSRQSHVRWLPAARAVSSSKQRARHRRRASSAVRKPAVRARRAARRRRADRAALRRARARSRRRRARRGRLPRRLAGAARVHRLRPPLLERRIVEERVRPRVEDLVRERRRLGRVARDAADLAGVDARRAPRARPSKSIASSRQSRTVWLTSG